MSAETTEAKVKDAKYDTATIQEAIMWLQENLPTQSIKGNSHCSPNAKLFYMKRFKCFDNYAVITTTTQTEIRAEVREVLEGERHILRGSASLPLYCVPQDTNGNAFKKAETSLIGRALRNIGILSKNEIKDDENEQPEGKGFQTGGFQTQGFQNGQQGFQTQGFQNGQGGFQQG